MKHFLLYGHGGSYNHGAEAIVKTTIAFLRRQYPGCQIDLSSHFKGQDEEFTVPADLIVERDEAYVEKEKKLNRPGAYFKEIYSPTLGRITSQTICLSVGGDTYCYPNWQRYARIHYHALKQGATSVLWSCSVNPQEIDAEMMEALSTHHLITVRESLSLEGLRRSGAKKAVPCADIAFLLEEEETLLPEIFESGNMVAINISPLVLRTGGNASAVIKAIQALIRHILATTHLGVALIPHVLMPMDNDLDAFSLIMAGIESDARICCVSQNLSAAKYKYILARCRFIVCARTHAAIAGYSSRVPVLAIGYSTKAEGIAKDMGMEDFVVPVGDILDEKDLIYRFNLLVESEKDCISRLSTVLPEYKKAAISSSFLNLENKA